MSKGTASGETGSLITQAGDYFSESVEELKKVSTPTRQETMQFTLITLVIVFFIAICLMIMDFVFNRIMGALLT